MFILLYITLLLLLMYGVLIFYYFSAWKKIPEFTINSGVAKTGQTRVSVVIPARNEEENIGRCLASLSLQTYPAALTEIIVVNDHSTDRTAEVVKSFPANNVRLVNLEEFLTGGSINSYKKKAIEVAVGLSIGDLIVTTDADCTCTPGWLGCLVAFHQQYSAAFIAAPVKISAGKSLLSIFQTIDFITLQGITAASVSKKFHSMCNGANLAYEKKAFYEVGGFRDIDNIASGDDMLLMHKIANRYPDRYYFLKNPAAIVTTLPASTWGSFFQQRIRWASKADKFTDKRIFGVLLLVYFLNLLLLVFLLGGIWNIKWLLCFILLLGFKTLVEYFFVSSVADFFSQRFLMVYFPVLQPLHLIYTVVAGWLGRFGTYEWKSRKVK
jgi:cellulose synthase/poly-beta-1,6-N-acetylglucosamine synthase-like glycosyltransferase